MDFGRCCNFMSALLWGNCAVFRPVDFICPDMADNGNIFRTPGGGTALLPPASPVCASVAGVVSTATFCTACLVIFVAVELLIGWSAVTSTRRAAEYVIVLGAKVRGSELSNSLKKRLDKALEYAENNPNTVLVLSGGKGEGEDISEAEAMYDYLQYNGIPESQLLLEEQSVNTVQNIVFSKKVIDYQEKYKAMEARESLLDSYKERSDSVKIAVLTSNYHVFRAEAIARRQEIEPVGVAAACDPVLAVHLWLREAFAVLKDKFMGRL